MYLRGKLNKNFKLEGTKFDGSWVEEDFDCDYFPISSLFDGACVYYEEPFKEDRYYYRGKNKVYPEERYLRTAPIYKYEGWYEG